MVVRHDVVDDIFILKCLMIASIAWGSFSSCSRTSGREESIKKYVRSKLELQLELWRLEERIEKLRTFDVGCMIQWI